MAALFNKERSILKDRLQLRSLSYMVSFCHSKIIADFQYIERQPVHSRS